MEGKIEAMKRKIDSADRLLELIKAFPELKIAGNGWIVNLVQCYFRVYAKKTVQCIDIEDILPLYDSCKAILLAQQEEYGERLVKQFSEHEAKNIFYLSNRVKNEIDREIMTDYPEVYEMEVLVPRKKELDKGMHLKFSEKIKVLTEKPSFPSFQSIEIETVNRCNGVCSFCPVNRNDDPRTYTRMSRKLFESIVLQLSAMDYRGKVNLFSNNEPLLDNRIIEFAQFASEHLPNASKVIFTNGTLLKKDSFLKLVQYLDILCIDFYYNSLSEDLSEELKEILLICLADEELQKKVMVQFVNKKAVRNNRGGQSRNRENTYQVKATCMLPYIQMVVRPDGRLSLCCNDAWGRNTLGDLNCESLIDAWNNENYQNIRREILQSRQNVEFCRFCDNYASLNTEGNRIFTEEQWNEAWMRVREIL